jgi:glycogen debranching enzyme
MNSDGVIEIENKFYISTTSSYADNRIMVLNHSDTFGVFDRWGDINQYGEEVQGIYHEGTRYLSTCEFRISNQRPLLLGSSIKEQNEILSVDLTNEPLANMDDQNTIAKSVLHIARNKFLRDGSCLEVFEFVNYGNTPVEFEASISFKSDFRDIFEVRGIKRRKRGEILPVEFSDDEKIWIKYIGLDKVVRCTEIFFNRKLLKWENDKAFFNISLPPGKSHLLEYTLTFGTNGRPYVTGFSEMRKKMEEDIHKSRKEFAHIYTSNEQLNHWLSRSQADLISLLAQTPSGRYPYAGVPWYNTAFGRDGIITALETLWVNPSIAHDVLLFLADNQATEHNTFQSSEPGKILHEMRGGEMVETKEIPFKKYYGSIDSTPLYIMLAGAYYQRTQDEDTIGKIWKNILAALEWIDKYGDLDGDGFVEYFNKGEHGLINQGWKDSFDSISDENGSLADAPIALCEVQGYVYDAKMQASNLAKVLHQSDRSEQLKNEAESLKKNFHKSFWDDELKTYVLALDKDKKPCRVRSSNAGHCLFSGIADTESAHDLVKTLMYHDMFTGWGIRTLSSLEKRYNPMSYHNGSVWPHDVALIASGFARYGFRREAMQLTQAMFDASLFINLQRLPELFCGFNARKGEGPTAYPVACSPQAWSVGAVFMLLESCLHMEINAPEKKVLFKKPFLPDFIDNIQISGLKLDDRYVNLEMHRYKDSMGLNVINNKTDWEIHLIK